MKPFLFILGRGRSGTTLLRAMFDAHPQMAIPTESHFIPVLARRRRRYEGREGFRADRFAADLREHYTLRRWGLDWDRMEARLKEARPPSFQDGVRLLLAEYALSQGKPRYGDKTPMYALHIDLLARLFPEGRFLHVIRDGRDVTLSFFDQVWGAQDVVEGAVRWKRVVRRARASGARLPAERYREVRYEALVADPEGAARDLCAFADLPFDDAMLRYHERELPLPPGRHHRHLREPPTIGLRDWRTQMDPRDVAVFEVLAGDVLTELGYERAVPSPDAAARARAWTGWGRVQMERATRRVGRPLRRRSSAARGAQAA